MNNPDVIHVTRRGWHRLPPGRALASVTIRLPDGAQTLPVVAMRQRIVWRLVYGMTRHAFSTGEKLVVVEGDLPRGSHPAALHLGPKTWDGTLTYGRRNVGIFTTGK